MTDDEDRVRFAREWVERHDHANDVYQRRVCKHVEVDEADHRWQVVREALREWSRRQRQTEVDGFSRVYHETQATLRDAIERSSGVVNPCACGHGAVDHGRSTVDTVSSCLRCGCWGFTPLVTPVAVPPAPVSPLVAPDTDTDTRD